MLITGGFLRPAPLPPAPDTGAVRDSVLTFCCPLVFFRIPFVTTSVHTPPLKPIELGTLCFQSIMGELI